MDTLPDHLIARFRYIVSMSARCYDADGSVIFNDATAAVASSVTLGVEKRRGGLTVAPSSEMEASDGLSIETLLRRPGAGCDAMIGSSVLMVTTGVFFDPARAPMASPTSKTRGSGAGRELERERGCGRRDVPTIPGERDRAWPRRENVRGGDAAGGSSSFSPSSAMSQFSCVTPRSGDSDTRPGSDNRRGRRRLLPGDSKDESSYCPLDGRPHVAAVAAVAWP